MLYEVTLQSFELISKFHLFLGVFWVCLSSTVEAIIEDWIEDRVQKHNNEPFNNTVAILNIVLFQIALRDAQGT